MADVENTNVNTETTNPETGAQQTPAQTQAQQQDQPATRTYTQEQLDAIIDRAQKRATKGLFTPEQMQAKDSTIATLTGERDAANADKAALQAELDELKHEKFLAGKGVPAEMREFYAYKIGKLVTEGKNFEQAAEEYLKDNPPAGSVRMSTGGGVSGTGGGKPQSSNEKMNAIFRSAK